MQGKIYLIKNNDTLEPLVEKPYPKEDLLQELLAKYPDLLAGDQMNESAPRRWLLISREMGVPGADGGPNQWSLDHLFLDQDAIPTLVEVKRSSNTQIRREVVGQMLDYAANAVVYWPVEAIRAQFEAGAEKRGQDPGELVAGLIEASSEDQAAIEAFWGQVKTNLQAAKIRLVFVADQIPPELKRIVGFLNENMDPVEVLAVELHQYVGNNLKTLVPRVIGQTADAQRNKATTARATRQWDEASFFGQLSAVGGAGEVRLARAILDRAPGEGMRIGYGKGGSNASLCLMGGDSAAPCKLMTYWVWGTRTYIEVHGDWLKSRPPFDRVEKREELRQRLNEIPMTDVPRERMTGFPHIEPAALLQPGGLDQFMAALRWASEQLAQGRAA